MPNINITILNLSFTWSSFSFFIMSLERIVMNRRKRTEILIKGDRSLSKKISHYIQCNFDTKVIEDPRGCLVMLKTREYGKGGLFYLGEVYATQCKAMVQNALGLGIYAGHNHEFAMDLAIIDAAYKGGLDLELFNQDFLKEEARLQEKERLDFSRLMDTKVDFSTMEVQDA